MPATPDARRAELIAIVCEEVVEHGIMKACEIAGVSSTSFFKWIGEKAEWAENYTRAREAVSYTVEPKIETILERMEGDGGIKPDAARVMIDAEKWLAGKRNAKVYGVKSDITSGGEAIKAATIVVASEKDKGLLEKI